MMYDEAVENSDQSANLDRFLTMAWAEPKYTKEEVNGAGKMLAAPPQELDELIGDSWPKWDHALAVVSNWRASHGYPLNTFQVNLRISARRFDRNPLIAQRTKRLSSITAKLMRFPNMKLTQMQDIGGCRAVLTTANAVESLRHYYEKESGIKHERASVDDYIAEPKDSGYRGVHLVYRYFSDKRAKAVYNGLKIEMQLRSVFQHAWATAVETVGTFMQQALKSSIGQAEWLRFFALMGSAIALREKQPLVPGTPAARKELIEELDHLAKSLAVEARLQSYGSAMRTIRQQSAEQASAQYYLLQLDSIQSELTVTGFRQDELAAATQRYLEVERAAREKPGADAVLVSVESLASLERAYPNYFADTRMFVELLNQALKGRPGSIVIFRKYKKK
jgi:hypothetical protein